MFISNDACAIHARDIISVPVSVCGSDYTQNVGYYASFDSCV
jgi:hypothetical protein